MKCVAASRSSPPARHCPAPSDLRPAREGMARSEGYNERVTAPALRFLSLLPLWEKLARTKSATDEGPCARRDTPHPPSLRTGTLSHKRRGEQSNPSHHHVFDLDIFFHAVMRAFAAETGFLD